MAVDGRRWRLSRERMTTTIGEVMLPRFPRVSEMSPTQYATPTAYGIISPREGGDEYSCAIHDWVTTRVSPA